MEKFINTKKEQFLGFDFLKNHTLPSRDVFDYRVHKKEYSEYFAQYGFQVSMVYADFYSRMWCSDYNDRYMSDDVYYYYVIPCLNRFDFINSYMDKNGYDRLFPDIKKPSILMKNINGRFFSPDDMPISTEEAVKLVLATDLDCIIKPSISDDVSPAAITNSKNQVFLERVLEKVHKAKEVADIVVAYPHVGGQYNPSPGFYTRFIIDSLKEAGADIIVANHPHTSLRCERLDNGVFCAYALGNLAFTPDVGFFLDNVLAEFGIVLHSYWDESTKRLIKLTFNVTRCMIGEDGITRVVEVSELYNRLTNKSERERLMIDNESVVNRFAGWAKSFEPYKEYVIF